MRSVHDMGGQPAGPVSPTDHERETWEKRTDALGQLLRRLEGGTLVRLDALRRCGESLSTDYPRFAYGERSVFSLTQLLIERGVINADELGRMMAELDR